MIWYHIICLLRGGYYDLDMFHMFSASVQHMPIFPFCDVINLKIYIIKRKSLQFTVSKYVNQFITTIFCITLLSHLFRFKGYPVVGVKLLCFSTIHISSTVGGAPAS